MAMTRSKSKGRANHGTFWWCPHDIFRSPDGKTPPPIARLSPPALALLVIVCQQLKPDRSNNGDLCVTLSVTRVYGWSSPATLRRYLCELVDEGFLMRTRRGGLNVGPALFAVTWLPIGECRGLKLDVDQGMARHLYRPEYAQFRIPIGTPVTHHNLSRLAKNEAKR